MLAGVLPRYPGHRHWKTEVTANSMPSAFPTSCFNLWKGQVGAGLTSSSHLSNSRSDPQSWLQLQSWSPSEPSSLGSSIPLPRPSLFCLSLLMIFVVNEVSPTLFSNYTTSGSSLQPSSYLFIRTGLFSSSSPGSSTTLYFFIAAANKVCLGEDAYFPNKEPQFMKRR